jgi:hypothetical protein
MLVDTTGIGLLVASGPCPWYRGPGRCGRGMLRQRRAALVQHLLVPDRPRCPTVHRPLGRVRSTEKPQSWAARRPHVSAPRASPSITTVPGLGTSGGRSIHHHPRSDQSLSPHTSTLTRCPPCWGGSKRPCARGRTCPCAGPRTSGSTCHPASRRTVVRVERQLTQELPDGVLPAPSQPTHPTKYLGSDRRPVGGWGSGGGRVCRRTRPAWSRSLVGSEQVVQGVDLGVHGVTLGHGRVQRHVQAGHLRLAGVELLLERPQVPPTGLPELPLRVGGPGLTLSTQPPGQRLRPSW